MQFSMVRMGRIHRLIRVRRFQRDLFEKVRIVNLMKVLF